VHAKGSINWINVLTIVSVAVLVGTELIGAAGAAGWAIGGLFQFGELITHILEVALILLALFGLTRFLQAVVGHEQLRY